MSMEDVKKVGSIGGKTVVFYMATTAFAITIGLLISNLAKGAFKVLETSGLEQGSELTGLIMDAYRLLLAGATPAQLRYTAEQKKASTHLLVAD